MKRKRPFAVRRRSRAPETLEDGQDSFLDVVSNLVGVLIILIMIAGARVRNAAADVIVSQEPKTAAEEQETDEEANRRAEYVAAVSRLEELSARVQTAQSETQEFTERAALVQDQAQGMEEAYAELFEATASVDRLLAEEAQKKGDAEREAHVLRGDVMTREEQRDRLQREKEALAAARPNALVLENIPTPISQRVPDGYDGDFCLKGGKISHVPLNQFASKVQTAFKHYRGDLTPRTIHEMIGPVDGYNFEYEFELSSTRKADGIEYSLIFNYGRCVEAKGNPGEPVEEALSNPNSIFQDRLSKYVREDTTIRIHLYPDSYAYLNDVKRFLLAKGYMIAIRPLPADASIAVSPNGTDTGTY